MKETNEVEDDPETIRLQIEATRERLADTAEAIAYKTDVPARVKENVAERVDSAKDVLAETSATVASTVSDVSETTRAKVSEFVEGARPHVSSATDSIAGKASDLAGKARDLTQTAKDAVAGVIENVKPHTGSGGDAGGVDNGDGNGSVGNPLANVSELTQSAKSAIAGATDSARRRFADTTTAAGDLVSKTRDNVVPSSDTVNAYADSARSLLTENPLGLALGSLAAGFLIGLALPVSDLERDNVGPLGEQDAAQAKAAASDFAEQGKAAVVSAVTEALKPSS